MISEMDVLKERLKATWMAGDYGHFAKYLETGAMEFMDQLQIEPGISILDVGCGAGQIAIPAARLGAKVTGIDLASNLIEQARERAKSANLEITFEQGDAEALPYDDESFELVVSLIGAMFAPRPERVAAELARVCRSGGRIVMANWTPNGFIGELFKTVGKHLPSPSIMPSPLEWGEEQIVRERFQPDIVELRCAKRNYPFSYPFGPAEVVEFYRTYYGPTNRAFGVLDETGKEALQQELEKLWTKHNQAKDGTTHYQSEYLLVTAVKA
ncbi:MAG: class I SAM-dependent methyltransferase [Candidatus Obscuribacterales bacterium]|nr:class I SAM-dependent methyltransferase [Candidatus Obscuribacterales bacterium]